MRRTTWAEFHTEDAIGRRQARIDRLRVRHLDHDARWRVQIGDDPPRARPTGARFGFVGSDYGGAGRVRSFWPAIEASRRGINVVWAHDQFPPVGFVDVLVVHRLIFPEQEQRLRQHLEAGTRVVFDEDDEIDAIPPGFDFGRYDGPGRREIFEEMVATHRRLMALADVVTVSTPRLVEKWTGHVRVLEHLPNYLPEWIRHLRPERAPGPLRVGWAGIIGTHEHDLLWLAPWMKRALDGATFTTVGGGNDTAKLLRLWSWPRECFPPESTSVRRFYELMGRADVGLVPLLPGQKLNLAKSWLKALEYAMLGIPSVVTRYPEQEAFVVHGETGFLADTPEEFAGYVQQLVWDPALREQMGRAAWERSAEFTLEAQGQVWPRALAGALGSGTLHPT